MAAPRPVRGRRIPTGRVAGWMEPMLATLVASLPDSTGWVFERKLDGIRALAIGDGRGVRLYSRNKLPLDESFPQVAEALATLRPSRFVLDGEVVAVEGGQPAGFEALQQRRAGLRYYVFDVLSLDGTDLRAEPLLDRKKVLSSLLRAGGTVRPTTHRTGDAERLRAQACEDGWEGLIAKRADSPYRGGRSRDWVKLKCVNEQEFVIAGFTDPKGSRTGFGALMLGYHEGDGLRFAGEVGTGFSEAMLRKLDGLLRPLEQTVSPFADHPRARKGQHFVQPRYVAQVGFSEWTRDGKLRHPRFLGLRSDKDPADIVREKPAG